MIWSGLPLATQLGWTLLHFLWEGAVLAGVLVLLFWLTQGRSPRLRYGLACMVLVAMAAAPVLTWLQVGKPSRTGHPARASAKVGTTQGSATIPVEPSISVRTPVAPSQGWERGLPWAVDLWLVGVVAMSLRLASGWAWLQWLRRRPDTVPASDDIQLRLLRLCQRMNLASNIRILLCEKVPGPTVMGWLRPVILLPPASLLGMPPDQMELVLAHEIAHILRHDFAINLLQSCVEVLLFYHPAVWWVSAKIRQERELCCDDLAVRTTGDALDYAAALTRLEALCRPPDPPRHAARALALGATGGSFMHRIRRLVSPMAPTPLAPRAGLILTLLLGAAFGLRAAHPNAVAINASPGDLVLRRYNVASADGSAQAGQVLFEGRKVPVAFGLQALERLMAMPAVGPVTELKVPIPATGPAEEQPHSYQFPAVDPGYLHRVLAGIRDEKPLTLAACPPNSVIIRRFNAASSRMTVLPGHSTYAIVASGVEPELILEALRDLQAMKPEPFFYQRVQKTGAVPDPAARGLTLELQKVDPDDLQKTLESYRSPAATPVAGELPPRFVGGQMPPAGTMWLRRYDRDSADGSRRAGTINLHVNTVPYASLMQALNQLGRAPADPARGYVDLDLQADPGAKDPQGLWTYLFLGVDSARVERLIKARAAFHPLRPEDKKPGTIVIQRMARFTAQLGVLPDGLNVQVWAGNVPAQAVLHALQQLLAVQPEAGIPQEVRIEVSPSEPGKRITLDLKDKNPTTLWDELGASLKAGKS